MLTTRLPPTATYPSLGENFTGGIAVNSNSHQQRAVLNLTDTVDVTGNIVVNSADEGKPADIFVYAEATLPPATDKLYFMMGEGLNISLWDENPANLVAFQRNVTLGATQSVSIYSGRFVYPGTLKVFFGYRLADGTMVTNNESVDIIIRSVAIRTLAGDIRLPPNASVDISQLDVSYSSVEEIYANADGSFTTEVKVSEPTFTTTLIKHHEFTEENPQYSVYLMSVALPEDSSVPELNAQNTALAIVWQ